MSQGTQVGVTDSQTAANTQHRVCIDPTQRWEFVWEWIGQRINPIVIKEVRQSLKSRQFSLSFGLTLVAAVSWTLLGIALTVPHIYFHPGGPWLLAGFFCILALPLMVIVPFSAFRSLTTETDDETYELLSISALSSTQIVYGKMASACVQIMLYVSALAPCIVLSYLLRGVGLFTILFLLGATILLSLAETAAALPVAAVCRSRMTQAIASVLLLCGLIYVFGLWLATLVTGLNEGAQWHTNPDLMIGLSALGIVVMAGMVISLMLRSAAAAIDFPSENSSTPLRIRIVGLLGLVLFWVCIAVVWQEELVILMMASVGVFCALLFVGALVTGERGVISPRTQRTLPKSLLGRAFLTWLFPGAGLGYVFLICLFGAWAVATSGIEIFYERAFDSRIDDLGITTLNFVLLCYLAMYLGINRLLMLAVPARFEARMLTAFALLIVVGLMIQLLPLITAFYLNDYRLPKYGMSQVTNVFWTVGQVVSGGVNGVLPVLPALGLLALSVFGLNLLLCTRDVMLVRIAEPPRVADEKKPSQGEVPAPSDPFA